MAVPEMQKAIGRLRFFLATIKNKEDDHRDLARQFQRQLDRAPNHALKGETSLEASLNIMSEIQERLDDVETTRKHLTAIKARAQQELQALEFTGQIEEAKNLLVALRERESGGALDEKGRREMSGLQRFIEDASLQVGQGDHRPL